MNILAEKQLDLFDGKITEEEFLKIYYEMRKDNENKFYSKLTLEQRKKIHKYILLIYTIKNSLGGFSYEIISDKRNNTNKPIIYVVTHVGKYDIEVVSEAIRAHYYLLSGDYEHIQGIIDEPFIGLNGIFYFNEFVKSERKKVSEDMINHLKDNGNLMYFIEGTWNMTPNLPMLPCYWGIVDIAKKGDAIIVPIAADQYGKHFKINIGNNFDMNKYEDSITGKTQAITELRDTLSTLKWGIWETEKIRRNDIDKEYWDKYVSDRFEEWPYFNLEYIDRLIYKPKDVTTKEEAYSFVKKMKPNKNNAFLYNKRLSDSILEKD